MNNNRNTSVFKNLDWTVVIIYFLLVVAGALSIYASSYDFDNASIFDFSEFSGKQFRWAGLSFVLGFVLLLIDRRMYETYAYVIYFLIVILLVVTIFIAPDINGSRSWIVLGSMSLQPAEFGKFATALALAKLFSTYNFNLTAKPSNFIKALLIIFVPIILILAQKETGSALVYMSLIFVLYREGMSGLVLFAGFFAVVIFVVTIKFAESIVLGMPQGEFVVMLLIMVVMVAMIATYSKGYAAARNLAIGYVLSIILLLILNQLELSIPGRIYMLSAIGLGILYCIYELMRNHLRRIAIPIGCAVASIVMMFSVNYVFNDVLQPHQQMRIKVTLGMEDDLLGVGYNVNQSKIAIGSGGFWGKGFLQGTQTKLDYVPEQHTDFIFCTIGEEEGFIGSALTVIAFLVLILRIITIAERQPTTFGRVYAYCVASYLIFHVCINIGMVIDLCPVIGIPLPFFSYGGSSLWGFTVLLFILLRIDASRRDSRNY
ncbi:MAG: rod shape-determining protein RodA [Muribaculaceae bacterium]|nr:rod shape-determining protein RodA [Muribaculaceae bacterium]